VLSLIIPLPARAGQDVSRNALVSHTAADTLAQAATADTGPAQPTSADTRPARTSPADALAGVQAAQQERIEVMARAARSVVCIFDENRSGGGSGVIITPDGYGLTNFHVAAAMSEKGRGLGGLSDGKLYPLQVLGVDPTGDVAMFRLTGRDSFDTAPLGDSDLVQVGDWVFAMGNPFLLAEDYTPTATQGLVSGTHRYQFGAASRSLVYTDCIQVDASINPGNSGGPLFNMKGELIGINGRASFETRGRVNVGAGYAISINQIKRFIPALRAGLLTEHGSLGATVLDLGYHKVVFDKMLEPSVASAAGIEVGDKLLLFGGREIHTSNQFANYLGVYPANWPVQVEFERGSEKFSRVVRLEGLPVNLPKPFKVDEELNRAEAKRVLEACRHHLGDTALSGTLRWRATRMVPGKLLPEVQIVEVNETPDGRGEARVLDRAGKVIARYEYTGRTALAGQGEGQMTPATPTETARCNLLMAARRAVYAPLSEDRLKRWKHVGGDFFEGRVVDLLEYASEEGPDVRVAIDPVSHDPVRAMWKPIDAPSRDQPAVEMELGGYRSVNGVRLPHQVRTFIGGEPVAVDTIQSYEVENQH
jgi:S1-C subfamily serine protease